MYQGTSEGRNSCILTINNRRLVVPRVDWSFFVVSSVKEINIARRGVDGTRGDSL